jgi:hypothetical protein
MFCPAIPAQSVAASFLGIDGTLFERFEHRLWSENGRIGITTDTLARCTSRPLVRWADGAHDACEACCVLHPPQEGAWRGARGSDAQEGARRLGTVQQGFTQRAPGVEAVGRAPRAQALPPQALAAPLCPHRLAQGPAQLWGLVHHKRQQHPHGTDHGEIVHAMAVIVPVAGVRTGSLPTS